MQRDYVASSQQVVQTLNADGSRRDLDDSRVIHEN
jgi:hypothetical protein